ncbi:DUF6366 family protein [Vagococcus salmoninarum]|uniref:DUF6366 family protein n=1 Tax=Vagococcus salmoninarum TaxID=2739 RepID=UPI0018821E71|nr:DUF6366 family protein [Vagococcus salmoninarum]MBE9388096.1 hypothetical protein [Vagococcus salmoninarum]
MTNRDDLHLTQEKSRFEEKKHRPLSSLNDAHHKAKIGSLTDLTSSLTLTAILIILCLLLLILFIAFK